MNKDDNALSRLLTNSVALPEVDLIEYFGSQEKAEQYALEHARQKFGGKVRVVGWEPTFVGDTPTLRLHVDARPEYKIFYGLAQVDAKTVRPYFSMQGGSKHSIDEIPEYSSFEEMLEDHLYPLRLPPDDTEPQSSG